MRGPFFFSFFFIFFIFFIFSFFSFFLFTFFHFSSFFLFFHIFIFSFLKFFPFFHFFHFVLLFIFFHFSFFFIFIFLHFDFCHFFIFSFFFSCFSSPVPSWAPPGLSKNNAFYYENLDFKARIWVREEERKKKRKKERKKKKEERADRDRSPSTIARTGPFCYSRAWELTPTIIYTTRQSAPVRTEGVLLIWQSSEKTCPDHRCSCGGLMERRKWPTASCVSSSIHGVGRGTRDYGCQRSRTGKGTESQVTIKVVGACGRNVDVCDTTTTVT